MATKEVEAAVLLDAYLENPPVRPLPRPGVLGVIVGAGIGAAGKSSTKTVTNEGATTTVQAAQTPARTVTHVVVHTHTVTQTAAAPAEPSSGSSSGNAYSGSGTKSLGTITVAQNSTIHWKAGGGLFSIDNAAEDSQTIALSSQGSSGESAIEAGTYHQVKVLAVGEWSFTIDPG